jgi:membrane protease YdiL (CAAX protease family)
MLSERPWRTDALLRLCASMVLCWIFIGASATSVLAHFFEQAERTNTVPFITLTAIALGCFAGALFFLGRTWQPENVFRNFAGILSCVYAAFFLIWWAQRLQGGTSHLENSTLKVLAAVLSFQCTTLLCIHRFLREHAQRWSEAFGLKNERPQALLWGLAAGPIVLPAGWGLQTLSVAVMEHFNIQAKVQESIQILGESTTLSSRVVLGVAAIVLAPLAEELLFRGILYPSIKQAGFPRLALWVSALLFGAIHANAATFLPLVVLALILVWLYEKTDNLLAPIVAHSLFNTINFIMLQVFESFNQAPPG